MKKKENLKISKKLKSLIGTVKLPENFDEEKAKDEYLTKKYLNR